MAENLLFLYNLLCTTYFHLLELNNWFFFLLMTMEYWLNLVLAQFNIWGLGRVIYCMYASHMKFTLGHVWLSFWFNQAVLLAHLIMFGNCYLWRLSCRRCDNYSWRVECGNSKAGASSLGSSYQIDGASVKYWNMPFMCIHTLTSRKKWLPCPWRYKQRPILLSVLMQETMAMTTMVR